MKIFLSMVPYRQANLVQDEWMRVHEGSAQRPRSLETMFVFNESLSDHFIAFVSFECCACFEHNSTSWWTSLKMNFIEFEIVAHAVNTTRLHNELHWKMNFIEFEKCAAWERCALKSSRWLYELCCCGWLPGRCEELALIPTRLTPHAHRKDWRKKNIGKKKEKWK